MDISLSSDWLAHVGGSGKFSLVPTWGLQKAILRLSIVYPSLPMDPLSIADASWSKVRRQGRDNGDVGDHLLPARQLVQSGGDSPHRVWGQRRCSRNAAWMLFPAKQMGRSKEPFGSHGRRVPGKGKPKSVNIKIYIIINETINLLFSSSTMRFDKLCLLSCIM